MKIGLISWFLSLALYFALSVIFSLQKYSDKISILFETPLKHISESFWSMVDDRHVETMIFLVKDNELVTEFYPKLDDIFKMKTLEIDLNSSEKPSKNILFLTFNILNKVRFCNKFLFLIWFFFSGMLLAMAFF